MIVFDPAPSLYDRFRPDYPAEAIDAMIEISRVPSNGAVPLAHWIGPGGRSLDLAKQGRQIDWGDRGQVAAAVDEPGLTTAAWALMGRSKEVHGCVLGRPDRSRAR